MGIKTPSGGGGAPTDAEYVVNSANSALDSETVVNPASEILTSGDIGQSTSISPGFDTFTQVSATAPVFVDLLLRAETDGSTAGIIFIDVDESGGTTPTYSYQALFADSNGGNVLRVNIAESFLLPAGAQFRIRNDSDPNSGNAIILSRATIISP
jgi:hypothetical protein